MVDVRCGQTFPLEDTGVVLQGPLAGFESSHAESLTIGGNKDGGMPPCRTGHDVPGRKMLAMCQVGFLERQAPTKRAKDGGVDGVVHASVRWCLTISEKTQHPSAWSVPGSRKQWEGAIVPP